MADLKSCRECSDHHYDRAFAGGVYEFALAAFVLELKAVPHLPERIRDILRNAYALSGFSDADILIPIPLSPRRRVERGYNQAEIVAQFLSREVGISMDANSLVRSRHTPMHRAAMDRKAREATVKNAFEVIRPRLVQNRSVVLVDDVLTTGATASACAKILKKNGAASVSVFTIARAVRIA